MILPAMGATAIGGFLCALSNDRLAGLRKRMSNGIVGAEGLQLIRREKHWFRVHMLGMLLLSVSLLLLAISAVTALFHYGPSLKAYVFSGLGVCEILQLILIARFILRKKMILRFVWGGMDSVKHRYDVSERDGSYIRKCDPYSPGELLVVFALGVCCAVHVALVLWIGPG